MDRTVPTPIGGVLRRHVWGDDSRPTAFDAFAGIGGNTLGLRRAGFRVVGAVDIDPVALESYKKNHRRSTVWEKDIRDLTSGEIMRELGMGPGDLDLLAGCPPCQGFSRIRTRNGMTDEADERNELVVDFLRLARELRPKTVIMENVPGLSRDHRLKVLLEGLKDTGYHTDHKVLNAAKYGVPQRRRRMIVFASRFAEVNLPGEVPRKRTVRQAIGRLEPPGNGDELHQDAPTRDPRITALIRRIPKDGGSRLDAGKRHQLPCHRKVDGFKDVYGRMKWDDVAPTITGGCINPSKGRFIHPQEDRAITLREAALLQSFPRRYHISLRRGTYHAAYMIGNALPPRFIEHLARHMHDHLTRNSGPPEPDLRGDGRHG